MRRSIDTGTYRQVLAEVAFFAMGPMVKLLTFGDGFEAKVVRARLTADGILCELRGGIDSVYPVGPVHLYVLEEDLELAQDLLAAAPEPASED